MNRIEGNLGLETYAIVQLTCGHIIYIDMHSGPKEGELVAGESLIYCIKCGSNAQIAKIKQHLREVQVVTDWDYLRQHIARDHDPIREALRMRETYDGHAGPERLPGSVSNTGVSRDEGVMDSPKGTETGRYSTGEAPASDVLAPRIE